MIKVGDLAYSRHGLARITSMEITKDGGKYGEDVLSISDDLKDWCVFDFDNVHWAYGTQVTLINKEVG